MEFLTIHDQMKKGAKTDTRAEEGRRTINLFMLIQLILTIAGRILLSLGCDLILKNDL